MNFMYDYQSYVQLNYAYWARLHSQIVQPITQQGPLQTKQIIKEEPTVKIQESIKLRPVKQVYKTIKIKKRTKKNKRKTKRGKKRDMSFSGKSQKENRNYTSIVCRTFLLYVIGHPSLEKVIKPINHHFNTSQSAENFLKTFQNLFDFKKSYIRKELMEQVCAAEICSKEFALIFRVLFRKFLKLQIFPMVFKSSKLNKKVKSKQSKYGKKVYETFFEVAKQQDNQKNSSVSSSLKSPLQNTNLDLKIQNIEQDFQCQNYH